MHKRLSLLAKHINKQSFTTSQQTIFDKILSKQIPSTPVFEDDRIYAFRDISPQAPVHVLIIPKNKDSLSGISKAEEKHRDILGYMMVKASSIAKELGLEDGYRLVINEGKNGQQTVDHLHMHLMGGRKMNWPPG